MTQKGFKHKKRNETKDVKVVLFDYW